LKHNKHKIIVGGASITQSPWPTWADIVQEKYAGAFFNTAVKGFGNEAIVTSALHQAHKIKNQPGTTVIIVMLTNIDKWDWYVDDPALVAKFSREKHTITKLESEDVGGFWSTGSWFPLEKELFKSNFYSQDYFVMKTLQIIGLFQSVCRAQGWIGHIMFDSPIFSMLESEINNDVEIDYQSNKLVNTLMNRWLYESLDIEKSIYHPGLIGFLAENQIPWYSSKYKNHPGTQSQFEFVKKILFPLLDPLLIEKTSDSNLVQFVKIMDRLWTA
jgi:hypothetical protein